MIVDEVISLAARNRNIRATVEKLVVAEPADNRNEITAVVADIIIAVARVNRNTRGVVVNDVVACACVDCDIIAAARISIITYGIVAFTAQN